MRYGLRLGAGIALTVAMLGGDLATGSLGAAPAAARGWHGGGGHYGGYRGGYYGHGGFGFGDFLLGAAIIGGTAAIISSANSAPVYSGYPTYQAYPPATYVAPGYAAPVAPQAYNPPPAPASAQVDPVEQCSRAAEREAQSRGGFARVAGIDRVDGRQNGAQVKGTLEVTDGRNGATRLSFDCTADYGQITGLRVG